MLSATEQDKRKIVVSKIDAAKRQIDCAIQLWFLEGDEVSVHTLLAASYQVIYDINKRRRTGHDDLYGGTVVNPEHKEQWQKAVKEASNFFKHANKDPESTVEFLPISNIMFMLYAITGLASLGEQSSPILRILTIWLFLHDQRFLSSVGVELLTKLIPSKDLDGLRPLTKKQFFETLLKTAADFEASRNR